MNEPLRSSESSSLLIIVRRHPRDPRRRRLRPRHIDRRLLLYLLLPRDPGVPIQPQCAKNVEDDVHPHDAEVAPSGRVLRAELCQVDIGLGSGAEFAISRGVFVDEVATYGVDIGGHVLAAGFAGARVKFDEFNGGADDVVVGQPGGEHAVDEVGEGGYAVHEDPETWESGGSGKDTGDHVSGGFQEGGERKRLTR